MKDKSLTIPVLMFAVALVTGTTVMGQFHAPEQPDKPAMVAQPTQSDTLAYSDVAAMKQQADAVFIGTIVGVAGTRNLARDPQDPSKEDPNTLIEGIDYNVKVSEFLKGADQDTVVVTEMKQLQSKGFKASMDEHYIGLKPGETYVFFVTKSPTTGKYMGVGQPFLFEVKDKLVKVKNNDANLVKAFKDQDLDTFKKEIKETK